MRRYIWEASAALVEEGLVVGQGGFADAVVEIIGHGGCLVGWLGEIVAETARGSIPGYFWADGLGTADCGDEGACAGELRCELRGAFAVVGLAGGTDALGGVAQSVKRVERRAMQ